MFLLKKNKNIKILNSSLRPNLKYDSLRTDLADPINIMTHNVE
jgi:hypothetical protein